jgi:hypothetical protein
MLRSHPVACTQISIQESVAYNYSDTMEASGWASMTDKDVAALTAEEKDEICDRVQQENQGLTTWRTTLAEEQ